MVHLFERIIHLSKVLCRLTPVATDIKRWQHGEMISESRNMPFSKPAVGKHAAELSR